MYDTFSADYDRFVNWPSRLAYELPFIEQQLRSAGAKRILDTACGTGMHVLAMMQRGYDAAGADLSEGMIARAQENAAAAGVSAPFVAAGFGDLAQSFAATPLFPFDALLCLGNSLPHLLTQADLRRALSDFAACLQPGGLLLIQNRNFDAVLAQKQRWMEPQSAREDDNEWVFLRFYDFESQSPVSLINFNIITLHRPANGAWSQTITTTPLRPLLQAELVKALGKAGFTGIISYGSMSGTPFDPAASGNLVIAARRQ